MRLLGTSGEYRTQNVDPGTLYLGKDIALSMNGVQTRRNNNVMVVGAAGAGKSRCLVEPNLLDAQDSYVISDPKGVLFHKYKGYLTARGYDVKCMNFAEPCKSSGHYNCFAYLDSQMDVLKIAHMLVYASKETENRTVDPFWDRATELLLCALIQYMMERLPVEKRTMRNLLSYVGMIQVDDNDLPSQMDQLMDAHRKRKPESMAVKYYERFRIAAQNTLKSILITTTALLGRYDTRELNRILSDDTMALSETGDRKTAVFVCVSDSDRSLDGLANLFFTQAMQELVRHADQDCKGGHLPVPVRFILDDFATNVTIAEFPRMISSIRSRSISVMLMIQAESQLEAVYDKDGTTIIANCDNYVYMGTNNMQTAEAVAKRCNMPSHALLNLAVGHSWVIRRGEKPRECENIDLDEFMKNLLRKEREEREDQLRCS